MRRKIYAFGMDGFIVPMMKRFAAEGSLPHFERMLREGVVNQTLPSFPVWTPTNWATLSTGAHTGTHGVTRWRVEVEPGTAHRQLRRTRQQRRAHLERPGAGGDDERGRPLPGGPSLRRGEGFRGRRLRPPQPPAHRLRSGHLPGLYHGQAELAGEIEMDHDGTAVRGAQSGVEPIPRLKPARRNGATCPTATRRPWRAASRWRPAWAAT